MNTRRHADDHFVSTRGNWEQTLAYCKISATVEHSLHVFNSPFLKKKIKALAQSLLGGGPYTQLALHNLCVDWYL